MNGFERLFSYFRKQNGFFSLSTDLYCFSGPRPGFELSAQICFCTLVLSSSSALSHLGLKCKMKFPQKTRQNFSSHDYPILCQNFPLTQRCLAQFAANWFLGIDGLDYTVYYLIIRYVNHQSWSSIRVNHCLWFDVTQLMIHVSFWKTYVLPISSYLSSIEYRTVSLSH